MIIICPNCESKFRTPKGAIGANGRFVRCSSCSHEWVAHPQSTLQAEISTAKAGKLKPPTNKRITPIDSTLSNKRSVNHRIYDKFAFRWVFYCLAVASVVALLGLNFIIYREFLVTHAPWLQEVYNELRLYNNNALKLELVDCHEIEGTRYNEKLIELGVATAIKNISPAPQKLSYVRFTLYNEQKKNLGTLTLNAEETIAPGKSFKIEGKLNKVPHDSKYIAVDFGNTLDLYLRDINYINIHRH